MKLRVIAAQHSTGGVIQRSIRIFAVVKMRVAIMMSSEIDISADVLTSNDRRADRAAALSLLMDGQQAPSPSSPAVHRTDSAHPRADAHRRGAGAPRGSNVIAAQIARRRCHS
jgi:hypothetical protein